MPIVRDLLTGRAVLTVEATATALDAARVMAENKIGATLVTTEGQLVGIFTERDLMTRILVAGLNPAETVVEDVMTKDVYTAGPDAKVAELRHELQKRHIRHIPVLEGDKIVGMLSLRDILRADLRDKAEQVETITKYIQRDELGLG